jgi:TolA-binding protein
LILVAAVSAVLWASVVARGESADARFLAGLRQRQLFGLAENYCQDRLSRVSADDEAQVELTVELIRTLAEHAVDSKPDEREALISQARTVGADFLRRSPPHPRAILVRLQDALTSLALGELGRQEFEAGTLSADQVEAARASLRAATNLLEALDRELTREIPLRRRSAPSKGELTADQLFSLQQQVQHQLARAERNRALLFEPGSDDRVALLSTAIETLRRLLTQLAEGESLLPLVQLDLAECLRLLGRFDEAGQLAASLDQEGMEPSIRIRARAELLRLTVARKEFESVLRLLEQGREVAGQSAVELDFAILEAQLFFAASASAGKLPSGAAKSAARLAQEYQDQAAATAQSLEKTYGSHWGRRADQLLVASLPRGTGRGNVQLLTRAADTLYLKGDLDEAISAYDEASSTSRAGGDLNGAFDLAYKAALVEQERQKHVSAANRLRILSKNFATHAQAARAHLLAAWNAAQTVRGKRAATDSYEAILREHLATWPSAETTAQARVWLGQLKESQSAWDLAIEAYADVPRSSPHFEAAIAGLAQCWPQHLALLTANGKPTSDAAADAIRTLHAALLDDDKHLPDPWTDTDRAVALSTAELIVAYQPSSAADAVKLLETALEHSPDANDAWKAAAKLTLILAQAEDPARRSAALAGLTQLAKDNPDNGKIQEKYAELLLTAEDDASLKLALDRWRIIASRSQPRTARWYRAKFSVALAQYRLHDQTGAATLLNYLLETPPGLKGTEWEAQYRDLLRKCESPD